MTGNKESLYYDQAREKFVKQLLTPEEIAKQLPVCANTIYKWRDKGDWVKDRAALLASGRSLAEVMERDLEEQFKLLRASKSLNAADIDAFYKLFLIVERLRRTQDIRGMAIAVLGAFIEWFKKQDKTPEEQQLVGNWMREWLRSLE